MPPGDGLGAKGGWQSSTEGGEADEEGEDAVTSEPREVDGDFTANCSSTNKQTRHRKKKRERRRERKEFC